MCRLRGTPILAARVPIEDGALAGDALVREILDAHGWAFAAPLAERAMASSRLPGWIDVESLLTATARASASGPLVTVVVETRDGERPTDACVASIDALEYAQVERREADGTEDGRRRAVMDANGDIVVFVAGDDRLDAEWLSRAVRVFLADPAVMGVVGLTLPDVAPEGFVPVLVRQWHRGPSRPAGGERTVAFWRTAVADLERVSTDAVLDAGHTVVYEPAAIAWTDAALSTSVPASAAAFARRPEAVRSLDAADPLRPIADATQYDRVRLMVSWDGVPIGAAHVDHRGAIVSPLWQSDAITQQLAAEILDGRLQLGRRVVWANIVSGLARVLAPWAGRPRAGTVRDNGEAASVAA